MTLDRRLAYVEMVVRQSPDPIAEKRREYLRWLSSPCRPYILARVAADRAHRRVLLEAGQDARTGWRLWHGLPPAEQDARTRRELRDLEAHIRALGEEAGWAAWFDEAADWPVLYQGATHDATAFARWLANERAVVDGARSRAVDWQARHPTWRPGMSPAEHEVFERSLMETLP